MLRCLNWPGGDLPATAVQQDLRWMPLMAALVALLFIGLPRFEFHSLLQAQQPRMQTSGFSDYVQLGDFARQLDEHVVMRVESTEPGENPQAFRRRIDGRYWRGVALSNFTGSGWQRVSGRYEQIPARSDVVFSTGKGIGVAVYREASDHAYVHLPDGAVCSIWWIWNRYYNRFMSMAGYRRSHACWLLLDRWLHGRGIDRQKHQPLRAISFPGGINKKCWRVFVNAWEAQAYGYAQAWHRRDLKRHLRALLKGC